MIRQAHRHLDATASQHLGAIFDEADAYCRSGEHLLSLATPPDALRFRRWFLGQMVDQIAGGAAGRNGGVRTVGSGRPAGRPHV